MKLNSDQILIDNPSEAERLYHKMTTSARACASYFFINPENDMLVFDSHSDRNHLRIYLSKETSGSRECKPSVYQDNTIRLTYPFTLSQFRDTLIALIGQELKQAASRRAKTMVEDMIRKAVTEELQI